MKTNSMLFFIISFFLTAATAYGQTKLVECTALIPAKSNAPIVILVKLQHIGKIQSGHIECTIQNKNLASIKSPEIVLAPGKKQIQMLLPPFALDYRTRVEFKIFFHSKEKSIFLGKTKTITIPGQNVRTLQIISNVPLGVSNIPLRLNIEQYRPRKPRTLQINTTVSVLPAQFFPATPLQYSVCDLIFLHSRYLQELTPKQRKAIVQWVKMGGSLFVVVFPITYQNTDIAFFNEMLSSPTFSPSFLKGRKKIYKHKGLGRVVFWNGSFDIASEPKKVLRETVGFLWKFTRAQMKIIKKQNTWSPSQELFDIQLAYKASQRGSLVSKPELGRYSQTLHKGKKEWISYEVKSAKNPGLVIDWVLPKTIRVIPTSLLVFLLLIFLIIVGPVDYYVLGLLRKRILTWIFFPLVTLSFLFFTMQLAKSYLGESEVHRHIDFVDIDSQNERLRCNRFQIYFAPTAKTISSNFNNAIWSIIDHTKFSSKDSYKRFNKWQNSELSKYYIHGQYPFSFTVVQKLNQWEPLITKTTIGQSKKDNFSVKIFLDKLESYTKNLGTGENLRNWRQYYNINKSTSNILSFAEKFNGNIYLLHKYQTHVLKNTMHDVPIPMLVEVSRRQQEGYFSLVSQISPTPGAHLEDLSVLDPTNPQQWLFIFVVKKGNNYVVYRRSIVKE